MKWFLFIVLSLLCGFVGEMAKSSTAKFKKLETAITNQNSILNDIHLEAQQARYLAMKNVGEMENLQKSVSSILFELSQKDSSTEIDAKLKEIQSSLLDMDEMQLMEQTKTRQALEGIENEMIWKNSRIK